APLSSSPPDEWARDGGPRPFDLEPGRRRELGLPASASGMRVTLRAPGGVVGYLLLVEGEAPWDDRDATLVGVIASQLALSLAHGLLALETRELVGYQSRLLDQTSVLLDSVDADGRVVTWNRASEQMLGVAGGEALGKRLGIEVARAVDPTSWDELWAE